MIGKFRLLEGAHSAEQENSEIHTWRKKTNEPGPIVPAEIDLCKRFNTPGGSPKFERVSDSAKASAPTGILPPLDETKKVKETLAPFGGPGTEEEPAGDRAPLPERRSQAVPERRKSVAPESTEEEPAGEEEELGESVFDSMSLADLKKHAAEEEIDLGHAKAKADVLKIIKDWEAARKAEAGA